MIIIQNVLMEQILCKNYKFFIIKVIINNLNLRVGLSVSGGDHARLKRADNNWDYTKIDLSWMNFDDWRIHPKW